MIKAKLTVDIEKAFYKALFYKNWACNCKNEKVRKKLIKKAVKELNLTTDEFKKYCRIEL